MKKIVQIANGIALIVTIVMNYLSNTGIFNGNTIAGVSGKYHNYFTPAGYAFSIWGLIYLGLFTFVIYQGRGLFKKAEDEWPVLQIGWWFIISCIANSLWVLAWLYDFTFISVLLMVLLFISLLRIVVNTKMELHDAPLKKFIFLWWPFCIYSGWVSVALIANVAAYLTKTGWSGFGISETAWAMVMIAIAAVIHIFMIWNRNMREFALVAVWALIAIAVANQHENEIVFWSAIISAIIVFINISIHGYQNRKSNPFLNNQKRKSGYAGKN